MESIWVLFFFRCLSDALEFLEAAPTTKKSTNFQENKHRFGIGVGISQRSFLIAKRATSSSIHGGASLKLGYFWLMSWRFLLLVDESVSKDVFFPKGCGFGVKGWTCFFGWEVLDDVILCVYLLQLRRYSVANTGLSGISDFGH